MLYYLLLVYPLLLIIAVFYGSNVNKTNFNEPFLDREQCRLLQGIFCVFVILHHLNQSVTQYGQIYRGPITILSSMGILFTSVFFFLSGYGLIYSITNKPDYLNRFLTHRLPVILIPFFLSNLIYVLVRILYLHIPMNEINILKCIFGYLLLNGNGWYIVEIFYLYLSFFIIFGLIKNRDLALILLIAVTVFIITIGFNSGHDYSDIGNHWFKGEWWYNSTVTFIMGLLFARFKDQLESFLKKYYQMLLPLVSFLFIITFIIEEKILKTHGYYTESVSIDLVNSKLITLIAQSILCLIFTLLIILINMKVKIGNKVLIFLSTISTELFLIHNLFIKNIFDFSYINVFLKYAIVLFCAIIAATVLHYIDAIIISLFQKIGRKKEYLKDSEYDLFRQKREQNEKRIRTAVLTILVVIFVATGIIAVYHNTVSLPIEYNKEVEILKNVAVGEEVEFGRYDTNYMLPGDERLYWIVLARSDSELILITKEGIDSQVYSKKHEKISWQDSDLCHHLNDNMFNQIFSSYEQKCIIPNPETGDKLSLLSEKQAKEFFKDDIDRQISVTQTATKMGVNINTKSKVNQWDVKGYKSSWWWLRGYDSASISAPIVTVDGEILPDGKYVNKPNGAVRPVIYISLN